MDIELNDKKKRKNSSRIIQQARSLHDSDNSQIEEIRQLIIENLALRELIAKLVAIVSTL